MMHNDNIKIGDNMKNKKGFTLVELLAVIVILGIIMTIATTSVIKSINDSKEKAKYIAAKEIVEIAEAYFAANSSATSVTISDLRSDYLESDATNPRTGENDWSSDNDSDQIVCRDITQKDVDSGYADAIRTYSKQSDYKNNYNGYEFDGYWYGTDGHCR